MIIGIISDTHGLLRKEVKNNLEDVDYIIHAGDIGKLEVIQELKSIAKVECIRGNCDKNIDEALAPEEKIIDINGNRIYLIHDIGKLNIDLKKENIDIVVFGHSHKGDIFDKENILYINPGSVGPKRFKLPITMVKLYIEDNNTDREFISNKDIIAFNNYDVEFIKIDV